MREIARYRCGFYYEQLSIDQKFLYQQIASCVSCCKPETAVNADEESIRRVKRAVQYDNPELFFWSVDRSTVKNGILEVCYAVPAKDEAGSLVCMIREKRRNIIRDLSEDGLTQERMFSRIYDYFVETVKYADDEFQKPECAPWVYDIQGPFLHERGLCLGIAQAVNYICTALHIPSILITGEARVAGCTVNHGWNMVKLDGQYYHVDATCDISEGNRARGRKYYLKKDRDFADRKWPKALYPKAV